MQDAHASCRITSTPRVQRIAAQSRGSEATRNLDQRRLVWFSCPWTSGIARNLSILARLKFFSNRECGFQLFPWPDIRNECATGGNASSSGLDLIQGDFSTNILNLNTFGESHHGLSLVTYS